MRLALPHVEHRLAHPPTAQGAQQGIVVDHGPAARIHDDWPAREALHEPLVGHVIGGIVAAARQRHMVGNQVALPQVALHAQRRVAHHHRIAHLLRQLPDERPHMAAANDAHHRLAAPQPSLALEQNEHRPHILSHRTGIAARTVHPLDARPLQVVDVQVVVPDGGRGHYAHPAAAQQLFVTPRPGAHNQSVGILHVGGTDLTARQVDHLIGQLVEHLADIRNLIVNYQFHAAKLRINE